MPTTTTSSGLNNLAMSGSSAPLFFEIFREVDKAESKDAKIAVLRKNDSTPLRQVLKGAFDPAIVWELPEGTPPYKDNEAPAGTDHTSLHQEARRLHYFIKGANKLNKAKREIMFIQMLEGLQAEEAKLLLNVKNKNLQTVYSGLTSELVREAFGWNDKFLKSTK